MERCILLQERNTANTCRGCDMISLIIWVKPLELNYFHPSRLENATAQIMILRQGKMMQLATIADMQRLKCYC